MFQLMLLRYNTLTVCAHSSFILLIYGKCSHIFKVYLQRGEDAGHKYFTDLNSATRSNSVWCSFTTFF